METVQRIVRWCLMVVAVLAFIRASESIAQYPVRDSELFEGVVLFEGEPVGGAEVFLVNTIGSSTRNNYEQIVQQAARTREDGSFSIPREFFPAVRTRGIFAIHPGYSVGGTNLSNENDPERITINLHRRRTISGTVKTPDGEPVVGASVWIYVTIFRDAEYLSFHIRNHIPGRPVLTDENGRYSIEYAPEGADEVALEAVKTGYYGDPRPPRVMQGATEKDIVLTPGGTITGRVTIAETGIPVPDIAITARSDSALVEGRTDENGEYHLDGLKPGTFRVFVNPDERHFGLAARPVESVTVVRGKTTDKVDIQLKKGIIISGTVTDAVTGEPLIGHPVRVRSPISDESLMTSFPGREYYVNNSDAQIIGWSFTDRNGFFEVTTLPGHMFVVPSWFDGHYAGVGTEQYRFINNENYEEPFNFELEPEWSITGTVHLPDGSPAVGVFVSHRPGPTNIRYITDSDGVFITSGSYSAGGVDFYVEDDNLGLAGYSRTDAQSDEQVEIHLKPFEYTSVSGRLVDTEGNPIAGETVRNYRSYGREPAYELAPSITDENGIWHADSLRVGLYYYFRVRELPRLPERPTQYKVVKEMDPIEFIIPDKSSWIAGQVVDNEGNPVQNAHILLNIAASGYHETRTNYEGRFRFESLNDVEHDILIFRSDPDSKSNEFKGIPVNTDREYVIE